MMSAAPLDQEGIAVRSGHHCAQPISGGSGSSYWRYRCPGGRPSQAIAGTAVERSVITEDLRARGANTTTLDIDLWFETVADPHIREAATIAGGIWISDFGMMPASLGGPLEDRLDVVLHMSGLGSFREEHARSRLVSVEGIPLRILPLDRILANKRAANRPKDLAVIPALEEALAATEDENPAG
jgi:hypothetical protein